MRKTSNLSTKRAEAYDWDHHNLMFDKLERLYAKHYAEEMLVLMADTVEHCSETMPLPLTYKSHSFGKIHNHLGRYIFVLMFVKA